MTGARKNVAYQATISIFFVVECFYQLMYIWFIYKEMEEWYMNRTVVNRGLCRAMAMVLAMVIYALPVAMPIAETTEVTAYA